MRGAPDTPSGEGFQRTKPSATRKQISVQMEIHFDRDHRGHRVSVLHPRLKLPVPYGLDRFLVQSHAKAANYVNIRWTSIYTNDHGQRAYALILRFARFLGELRIRLVDGPRRRNPATHAEYATTHAAAFARTKARALAGTDAAATPASNAAPRSRTVRRQHRVRHRVAQVRHVVRSKLYLGRNHNGRLNRQFRILYSNHRCRGRNLLHREFRQPSLAGLQHVAIAAATAAADLRLR